MNLRELLVTELLERDGWTVFRKGLPDILAHRGERLVAIEVKSPLDRLKPEQEAMKTLLPSFGIPYYVIVPDHIRTVDMSHLSESSLWRREELFAKHVRRYTYRPAESDHDFLDWLDDVIHTKAEGLQGSYHLITPDSLDVPPFDPAVSKYKFRIPVSRLPSDFPRELLNGLTDDDFKGVTSSKPYRRPHVLRHLVEGTVPKKPIPVRSPRS